VQHELGKSALRRYFLLSVIGYTVVYCLSFFVNRTIDNNEFSFIITYLIVYTLDFVGNAKFVFKTTITRNMINRYLSVTIFLLCLGTLLFNIVNSQFNQVSLTTVVVGILVSPIRFTISGIYIFGNSDSIGKALFEFEKLTKIIVRRIQG
jgi:hypothetical protein